MPSAIWSHSITWLKGLALNGWELLAVYHQPDKYGDHRQCDCGDLVILTWQMTSRDALITGWSNFMSVSSSLYVSNLLRW